MRGAGNRLKEIRLYCGLTQQELGSRIGLSQPQIKNIETGIQKLTVDIAEKLAKNLTIDPWWLLTGKGQMHASDTQIVTIAGDTIALPLISGSAQAGGGNDISGMRFEVVETMTISRSLFKTPPESTVRIIKVGGYSMTPMLYPDSYCIFDECGAFVTDGLYIINYSNELMVKLLQIDPQGNLHIKSTNPDYNSWIITPTDQTHFHIIGKVLRIII